MPWGISHKYKFIFIHIPKTAGTTICSSWEGSLLKKICKETGVLGGTHKTIGEVLNAYPEAKHYFRFTVVRNPYDRFVSKFYFKQLEPRQDFDLDWTDKEAEGFLPQMFWITDSMRTEPDKANRRNYHYRSELHYGPVLVNRILRYENLEAELKETLNELGIDISGKVFPHFRQTRAEFSYHQYFDEKMRSLCKLMYREDLDRLGYGWESS
jgi:hypothetical protein